jgi:hypothetical protein
MLILMAQPAKKEAQRTRPFKNSILWCCVANQSLCRMLGLSFTGVRITAEDVAANRGSCSIGQYSKKKS